MRYTAGGSPAGGWPATGALVLGGPTFQEEPDAVPDGAGGAVVTCQVGSDSVVAQRVTAAGGISSGWPADGVTLCRHVTKSPAFSISDGASGAIFAWSATNGVDDDIFAQRAAAGGTLAPGWPDGGRTVCAATGDQINPSVVTDGSNGTIAVWEDDRGVYSAIYAARVLADGTVGALTALASARAEPGLVTLSWWSPAGTALDATLERAEVGAGFVEIARLRLASGLVTYEDRDVVAGRTYQYRIAVAESGRTSYLGAVTLHVPEGYRLALAGLLPNPVVGATRLAYSLPTAEPAHIEVLDASGRRVIARDLDSAPGEHVVAFDRAALRPGIYVLKLSQGSRAVMARAAIVR
jgi:hypothetical protein